MQKHMLLWALIGILCAASARAQMTFDDSAARQNTSARIERNFGLKFAPSSKSLSELLDIESRLNTAARIKRRFGEAYDYDKHSLSELLDVEARMGSAERIQRRTGAKVDWTQKRLSELLDVEMKSAHNDVLTPKVKNPTATPPVHSSMEEFGVRTPLQQEVPEPLQFTGGSTSVGPADPQVILYSPNVVV